jgi:glycosyltransferase involved in cell wall biosynthesis
MTVPSGSKNVVVATLLRSTCDPFARALQHANRLRLYAAGTRRLTLGIAPELARLNPAIGLTNYIGTRILPEFRSESFRFRLHPWFDHWVKGQLQAGDHLLSAFGFVNESFKWVRANGGHTFIDAGNSHPENFWRIISEEHARWGCSYPPIARHQHERFLRMLPHVDYVLAPSEFVARSYLDRGFRPEQILRNTYPLDFSCFTPSCDARPNRPLTLIATGSLSLRKGTPYLLEAFRMIRRTIPDARLLLTTAVEGNIKPVLKNCRDIPIEWAPILPHPLLAERLRSADIFLLPSLEDGFARTLTEALACGLPAITTLNTGASDFIVPGVNGEIVPIRDAQAIASAVLAWRDRILSVAWKPRPLLDTRVFSFEHFAQVFLQQLKRIDLP